MLNLYHGQVDRHPEQVSSTRGISDANRPPLLSSQISCNLLHYIASVAKSVKAKKCRETRFPCMITPALAYVTECPVLSYLQMLGVRELVVPVAADGRASSPVSFC